jgi:hypothetical protein
MNRLSFRNAVVLTGVIAFHSLPSAASACTACMGDPNSKSAGAINGALFLMLGVIGLMLGSVGAFAYCLIRRANAPTPPHVELAQMNTTQEESN